MVDPGPRRIVTGLDAEGKSCVIIDDAVPRPGSGTSVVWRTATVPADNSGRTDDAAPFSNAIFHDGGSTFMLVELDVGIGRFMHATDTIDYLIVLEGEVVIELETGEARIGPGGFIVDRGVLHSWRNDGPEKVVMASIILPAQPIGRGSTL